MASVLAGGIGKSSNAGGSSDREGGLVGAAEGHAGQDGAGRLEVHLARALVVAGVDELDGAFRGLQQGHVGGGADLQGAELGARSTTLAGLTVAMATTCSRDSPMARNLLITQVRYGIPGVLPEDA